MAFLGVAARGLPFLQILSTGGALTTALSFMIKQSDSQSANPEGQHWDDLLEEAEQLCRELQEQNIMVRMVIEMKNPELASQLAAEIKK